MILDLVEWVEDGKPMAVDPADHKQATADVIRRWAHYGLGLDDEDAGKLKKHKLTGPDLLTIAKMGDDKIKAEFFAKPYELSGGAALKLAAAISRLTQFSGLVWHVVLRFQSGIPFAHISLSSNAVCCFCV
jgi:hypothetical protein